MIEYNTGSLLFGLLAWGLPLAALLGKGWRPLARAGLTGGSFACCALALCLQILECGRRVELEDWSALMDTWDAVVWVSVALLAVTAALNAAVWLLRIWRSK